MTLAPLRNGTAIAPGFEVLGHLSRGRRLDVYDAWDRERGCRCVIKALRPERLDDDRAREALLDEGRLLSRLAHPHLVRGYEVIETPEPLIVIETLGGQTLDHMLESDGPLSVPDAAQLGLQLGSAMRYLHANGVLHLDLKPSNVVAEAGRAKVIDLSVARPPGPAHPGIGTWCYMAPEQFDGGELGLAADVWGIGAVLLEGTTGEPPFEELMDDGTGGEYVTDSEELEDRSERIESRGRVPDALAPAIESFLSQEPASRPSIVEAMAALEPLTGLPRSEWRWQGAVRPAGPKLSGGVRQLQDRGSRAAQHPLRRG